MKVLSLFDGISCGMVALERAGIPVERYVAYEIEQNAIKISKKNYPMIEQSGDVFKADFTEYRGFDLLIGGSPCTHWSIAQNRQRLYWTNIPNACVPSDKGILLKDIIESGNVDRDKALCLARRYAGFSGSQSYLCRRYFGKSFGQAVFEGDIAEIKDKWKANPYFESDEQNIRQMTIKECERLQTLPDDYTDVDGVSTQMRYEAIGNGWTVDVIAHIFTGLK